MSVPIFHENDFLIVKFVFESVMIVIIFIMLDR